MKLNKTQISAGVIVILLFATAIYFYPQMPEQMASHWNASGQANGYMSKFWGLFLVPIISIPLLALFFIIPYIDPLRANIEKFKTQYHRFVVLIMLYMFYIYLLTIAWNLGYTFNMTQMLIPAFAVLFYYSGVLIEKAKRNWFIGIRTPWTISSDRVWDKTHSLGGKLFKLAALISLLGMLFPDWGIYFILYPIIAAAIITTVYSYLEYRKENGAGRTPSSP